MAQTVGLFLCPSLDSSLIEPIDMYIFCCKASTTDAPVDGAGWRCVTSNWEKMTYRISELFVKHNFSVVHVMAALPSYGLPSQLTNNVLRLVQIFHDKWLLDITMITIIYHSWKL